VSIDIALLLLAITVLKKSTTRIQWSCHCM